MTDLIRRSAVIDAIRGEREYLIAHKQLGAEHVLAKHADVVIDSIPAVDAVEVVRCRECRYSREPNRVLRAESIACAGVLVCCVGFDHVYPTPDDGAIFVDADGFCSQGQRREGGDA